MNRELIRSEVRTRSIKQVVHFTRLYNLDGILKNGLLPKDMLDSNDYDYEPNDQYRIDDCTDASCLSISFPNYKMFYACRMQDKSVEWIVISFHPKILWKKDCAFCLENAASSSVTCLLLEDRKKSSAFQDLFKEYDYYPDRSDLDIPDYYTTNPQAEILVFEPIEAKYVRAVYFQNKKSVFDAKNKFKHLENIRFAYSQKAFSARNDYKYW